MSHGLSGILGGVGLGMGLMYLLDPVSGRRRRARLRDQLTHLIHQMYDAEEASLEDVRHRAQGLAAELRSLPRRDDVDDLVLVGRVRSRMGRLIRHPGAIAVTAEHGTVTLGGQILADEADRLIAGVRGVPGVRDAVNQLELHQDAGDVPALQGNGRYREARHGLGRENWPPSQRLFVGTCAAILAIEGLHRRGILGSAAGGVALVLLARALTNLPVPRLLGIGRRRRGIDVHKTINVQAPVEPVYQLWSQYANFPRFMEHVQSVHPIGADRSSWTVSGPLDIPIHWEAEITRNEPNREIAWRSLGGTSVPNAGVARFESNPDGSTRIDLRLTYAPPGGLLGHAIACLLGGDPRHELDDDLVRFKSLVECGKTTAHGQRVEAADLVTSNE